jgi:hypothetical protein
MTYGPDAVHEIIVESELSYPVTTRRLENSYPMRNVVIDADGNSMMLPELLYEADVDRFKSRADLEAKLGPVCERESNARQNGIIDRFKRAFL